MSGKQKGAEAALRSQLVECQDKIERLEFDRCSLQHRLREQQEAARKEATASKERLEELKAKYAKPPESEKVLDALGKAVLSTYIEVKDRKVLHESDELQAENRALARVNPLVILSYLRTKVRNMLATHEDCELDLRAQLKLNEDEAQRNVRNLKDRMALVQATQTRAISMAEEARTKLEDAEHAKDAALEDTRGLIEQVKADQMTLVLQMRAKGEENEKLQKVITEKDKQLKRQETKMLQMASLESEIQSLRTDNLLHYKKMQSQHEAKTAQFQNDIKRLVKLEAENQRYSDRVCQLEAELKKAKTSYTVMHYLDEQAKSGKLESLYRSKTKAYEEVEVKLKALEKNCERHKADAQQWEKTYHTLLDAVHKQNKKEAEKNRNPVDVRKKADELSVVYYKDLVREKDKEIQTLLKRIKRLSATDLRSRLTRRHGDQERQELSSRIASLSYELDRAQAAQKELQFTSDAQEAISKVLPHQQDPLDGMAALSSDDEMRSEDEHSDVACDDDDDDSVEAEEYDYEWEVRGNSKDTLTVPLEVVDEVRSRAHSALGTNAQATGQTRRPLSALSRSSRTSAATSRPQSVTTRSVNSMPQSAASRPQSAKRVALAVADSRMHEDDMQDGFLSAIQSKIDSGGQVQLGLREVGRIKELEEENVRMSMQLKQLKNVMAVSQGAADAYMVRVLIRPIQHFCSIPSLFILCGRFFFPNPCVS